MCWPASVAAAFFLALFIYDIVYEGWTDLPYHAGVGVGIVALLWITCIFVGEFVSAGVLVIPLLFVGVFLFTLWFTGRGFEKRGCCINCGGGAIETKLEPKKLIFIKKPQEMPIETPPAQQQCVDTNLNAKSIL